MPVIPMALYTKAIPEFDSHPWYEGGRMSRFIIYFFHTISKNQTHFGVALLPSSLKDASAYALRASLLWLEDAAKMSE